MLARDEASVNALADAIEASKRQLFGGGTSISGAIDYSRISTSRATAPTIADER
jgi:hypothetical protein